MTECRAPRRYRRQGRARLGLEACEEGFWKDKGAVYMPVSCGRRIGGSRVWRDVGSGTRLKLVMFVVKRVL